MDEPELKIIDVFICKLRKKLSQACDGENYIETVWGRGYVLRDTDMPDGPPLPEEDVPVGTRHSHEARNDVGLADIPADAAMA